MRQRKSWKQHIRDVGHPGRKPHQHYPQAHAAAELWARDNLKDGFTRYQSPCAKEQAYGTVTARGATEYNEVSEAVSRVLAHGPDEALAVFRAHYLGVVMLADKAYRIPRSFWPAKIAARYFNATADWYENWHSVGLHNIAVELGLDGQ